VEVAPEIPSSAGRIILAEGKMVSPGFVDVHMHIEKGNLISQEEAFSLRDAIDISRKYFEDFTKENIKERAKKTIDMAIQNGTTALRTHTAINPSIGLMAIEAIDEVKKEVRDLIDIQIVAMISSDSEDDRDVSYLNILEELEEYEVEVYGGAPHLRNNPYPTIDKVFELAKKNDKGIDFHVDETDEPRLATLNYISKKTIEYNMQGKVTVGHLCALAAVSDREAKAAIALLKESGLHVVTLPSCNLYLMGRHDKEPRRRGILG
jgi:cytosine deaminase